MDLVNINITELAETITVNVQETPENIIVNVIPVNENVSLNVADIVELISINIIEVPQNVTILIDDTKIGLQGPPGEGSVQFYICGENITSHAPVALVGGVAYKMSNTNPLHQFAFVGFSKFSGVLGGGILIENKLITLAGWGLLPNTNYLCGVDGGLITTNAATGFTKIVGFSQSSDSLLIVNNYTSINKN